jgi:uncharacterized protein
MPASQRFLFLLILISPVFLIAQDNKTKINTRKQFLLETRNERNTKNKEFLEPDKSPLPAEEICNFKGLKYFRADPAYKVTAIFDRIDMPVTFRMKTTTDRQPEYRTFAKITFSLNNTTLTLNVYQNVELTRKPGYEDYLFVPFTDETSAKDSYEGGRFLDLKQPTGNSIVIDFNKAYNPYCAYNHKYSCPVPPPENHLPVQIKAGEKKYN